MTQGKKETLKSFFYSMGSKVLTYFLLLVLGNFYLQSEYGKFSFVLSMFQLAAFFCFIGLPYVFVPWRISKKDTNSVFYFLLVLTIIFTLGGILVSINRWWILPLILTLPFHLVGNLGSAILISKHKYNIQQIVSVTMVLAFIVFGLLFKSYGKFGIILSYTIGYLVSAGLYSYLSRKEILELAQHFRFKLHTISIYVKKGIIVSLLWLSFAFLGWIDSVILGIMSTFENVAKYNIAGPISNVITLIPISLSMFLLTRSAEEKIKKYSEGMLHRTLRLSFSFSLILAILINSFLFLIIRIFFPKYQGIESFVMILSIGILFYAVYNLMYTYLAGKLAPEKAFWPIVSAALLNIVLDIALIPKFGLYGITIATMAAHMLAFSLFAYKMGLLRRYWPAYLLVLAAPLSFYLGYYGALILALVVPVLFFTRLIEKDDLGVIVKTVRSVFGR